MVRFGSSASAWAALSFVSICVLAGIAKSSYFKYSKKKEIHWCWISGADLLTVNWATMSQPTFFEHPH